MQIGVYWYYLSVADGDFPIHPLRSQPTSVMLRDWRGYVTALLLKRCWQSVECFEVNIVEVKDGEQVAHFEVDLVVMRGVLVNVT